MADESLESILRKLGLEDTIYMFKEEDIDLELLKTMTIEDLKETGLSLGKRQKILYAVKTKGKSVSVYSIVCVLVPLSFSHYLFM